MKQILQDLASGQVVVADVPDVEHSHGLVLVRVEASLLSAGTEGAQVAAAGRSVLQRVIDNPALLRRGWEAARQRGLRAVRDQVESRKTGYLPLGYSCAGVVIAADPAFPEFPAGARVACAGGGYANHAERVAVPGRLCARVPDTVSAESAAYATLGAIAMQGLRQGQVQLGETVAVIGLGLVGQLTAQLLKASGCSVVGVDPAAAARQRGLANGCDRAAEPAQAAETVMALSRGIGADAVIICAAAADSSPVALAGELARSRGRVVMVGATGMEIPRELYFRKELTFALSRSYGPGRYDPTYEEFGWDYPVDHVRFTEQRHLQAFLDLVASGALNPERLTTHRFDIARAPQAYALLGDRSADRAGIVLTYPASAQAPVRRIEVAPVAPAKGRLGIGFIGAGEYASSVLLPLLRDVPHAVLQGVATRQPSHGLSAAKRFGFAFAAADAEEVLDGRDTSAICVTTRHDSHARYAVQALERGHHVWVEKPLALTLDELRTVADAVRAHPAAVLVVGFNRRFSPLVQALQQRSKEAPRIITCRVNAGLLPPDHWTHDPSVGGGRLVGEGCHFFDLLCALAGADPVSVHTIAVATERRDLPPSANFAATVKFADGSIGQLQYSSAGPRSMPKERIEVLGGGESAVLDDFQSLTLYDARGSQSRTLKHQDKGQAELLRLFVAAARGAGPRPLDARTLLVSSALTLAAQESLALGAPVDLHPWLETLAL